MFLLLVGLAFAGTNEEIDIDAILKKNLDQVITVEKQKEIFDIKCDESKDNACLKKLASTLEDFCKVIDCKDK